MKLKKIVAISLIASGALLGLVLVVGLLVPASVFDKIGSKTSNTTTTEKTIDGKKVTETVNPATGEKTVTVTDPTTGETKTTTVASNVSTEQATAIAAEAGTSGGSTTSTPASGGGSTPAPSGGGSTPAPSGGGGAAVSAPVVSLSVSPSSITSGSSATLGWSATNTPTGCTASGGWSGAKAASGTASVNPTSTTTYTLTCNNAGGSGTKSATLTVSAPVAACGQAGGSCGISDITGHTSESDCRTALSATGGAKAAYAIPSSFLSLHNSKKSTSSVVNLLCGKVYANNGGNLANGAGDHRNGATISGKTYSTWMSNFYLGPYN